MKYSKQLRSLNVYKEFKLALRRGILSQAYLFISPDRLTNKYLLLEMSRSLYCENEGNCTCANCLKIEASSHPDVLIYPKEGTVFNVENANEIYDKIQIKPIYSDYKIFIINDIDVSTEQAQNKILKIVEEPPQNVIFLISAVNENKILQTIKSRVQKKYIDRMNSNLISELFDVENNIKQIALENGDGYLGKTINYIENKIFLENYENMKNLLFNFKKSDEVPYFSIYFSKNKVNFEENLLILNDFYRDLLMFVLNLKNIIKNKSLINDFEKIAGDYSPEALNNILINLSKVKEKLDRNVNLVFLADNMLMDILEVKFLCK